jgi:hypothetical protein
MKPRVRVIIGVVAAVALLAAGIQAAFAVTPNDVQYNTTTSTATVTTATTTTNPTSTKTTTTSVAPVTQNNIMTPPSQSVGVKGSQSQVTPTNAGGTLPFTGLDLGLVFAAGALLVAGGFALRRLGRKSDQNELSA